MKIKINWGWGIVIALAAFIIFISSLVIQMIFNKDYNHQLVSENYYKDELLYQLEVDKIERSEKLSKNVSIIKEAGNLKIIFPENMNFADISGVIYFQNVIDEKFDFEQKIVLKNHIFEVDSTKILKGTWRLKVDWKYQDVSYLLKERIFY